MKYEKSEIRHSFLMLKRLLEEVRKGKLPGDYRRVDRCKSELDNIIMAFYDVKVTEHLFSDRVFDMDKLKWRKKHVIKRSKYQK